MDWNLFVSVLVLIGTVVLIWLTARMIAPAKPHFRLDRIVVDPWSRLQRATWVPDGTPLYTRLIFVNDGPGMAPETTVTARGLPNVTTGPIRFPRDGSPTLQPGGEVEIDHTFATLTGAERWPERNFMSGDDFQLDLRGVTLTFEWREGRKRRSWTLEDLHAAQRPAPSIVAPEPPGIFG